MSANNSASAGPPPTVDVQDPLPESNFIWRRIFSYVIAVALVAILALVVWRVEESKELREIALYLCLLLWMVVTYYMIAPSAEQVVKILQTAKLFRQGVNLRQTSTASNEEGHVSTQTTVGKTAEVTSPPPPPAPADDEDVAPRSNRT